MVVFKSYLISSGDIRVFKNKVKLAMLPMLALKGSMKLAFNEPKLYIVFI